MQICNERCISPTVTHGSSLSAGNNLLYRISVALVCVRLTVWQHIWLVHLHLLVPFQFTRIPKGIGGCDLCTRWAETEFPKCCEGC